MQALAERFVRLEAEVRDGDYQGRSLGGRGCRKRHLASVMSGSVRSAGLLPYRNNASVEVLIAHPGGPYFAHRHDGWWSVVKGIVEPDETDEQAVMREFAEETGWPAPAPPWIDLGETTLKSRKVVTAWAVEADFDPDDLVPGHFRMGNRTYPEIDRVVWASPDEARRKLNRAQGVFVDRLLAHLDA